MTTQDEFFDVSVLDVFPSEVDAVVISIYQAAMQGIEMLDRHERGALAARDVASDPLVAQERRWWEDQMQELKYHAGNMGLVSLILLSKTGSQTGGGKSGQI